MSIEQIEQLQKEATADAAAELLTLAKTAEDKAITKAAKRALYLLSQKGIVPEAKTPAPQSKIETVRETLRGYASAYDGEGNSLLMVIEPDKDGGSPYVMQTLLNDVGGIRNFGGGKLERHKLNALIARYEAQKENGVAFVEITSNEVRRILQQAHVSHTRAQGLSPHGFMEWAQKIGVELTGEPEILLELPAELTAQPPPETPDTKTLFTFPYFETWFLESEMGMGMLSVLHDTGKFSADASQEERDDAMQTVMRNAATDIFTPEVRSIFAKRLEYSATILWRLDKKDAAHLAWAHAVQLRTEITSADIEFARAICERTLWAAYEMYKRDQQEKGK